mmetsp:Transcript_84850/g.262691  ORF Transcript_84850/g.262691 Transcript_84850/m.262691 type:complete len:201 (+) Transcript_84850:918-1520(+)
MPRPAILHRWRSSVIQMLEGLMSRWTKPAAWMAAMPATMCENHLRASCFPTERTLSWRSLVSVPSKVSGSHSVTRQALVKSFWSQQSLRRMTTGEAQDIFLSASASRLIAFRCRGKSRWQLIPERDISLMATRSPSAFSAKLTPPRPSWPCTSIFLYAPRDGNCPEPSDSNRQGLLKKRGAKVLEPAGEMFADGKAGPGP